MAATTSAGSDTGSKEIRSGRYWLWNRGAATASSSVMRKSTTFEITWKIAVGTSYRYNDQWKARFGVAFDQTPVTDHPTARLPDSDRWWLTLGGEYRWTRDWKFDAGLVYIKGDSAEFDQRFSGTEAATLGQIRGSYDASVWIMSAQAVYSF